MDITYEEFFNPTVYVPHQGIIAITRELVQILGKEKVHEIIGNLADKLTVDVVNQYFEGKPINSLHDFDTLMKGDDYCEFIYTWEEDE